jgi:hypothetical protein
MDICSISVRKTTFAIVSDADLRRATQQQEAHLNSVAGTISGTIADFDVKKGQPKVS